MKLLAIDTTTDACSVALQVDGTVIEQHRVEARAHTRILLPMIRQLLADGKLRPVELDAVVLGNGPGSFVGMRISASVAQDLCFAAGVPLLPVSSLAAIALQAMADDDAEKVAVAQDARMNEVYFAAYRRDANGLPIAEDEERIVAATTEDLLADCGWTAAGQGWQRYPQLSAACGKSLSQFSNVAVPRARCLIPLGIRTLQQGGAIDPQALAPAYLRQKVASAAEGRC
jgi:tRNA threonylcarbamoyladenosine biosynthesis protein TsaB